jgi:IclR family pca regulon transcriptional regulator
MTQRPIESTGHSRVAVGPAIFPDPNTLPIEKIDEFCDDPDFVTSLARGLAVLLALSDKKRHLSIAQVSYCTGIPRAAVRRSLLTLAKLGFAACDDTHQFYLRPRVLSFSHAYLSASPISMLAQPVLDRLSESIGEACSLAVMDGDDIVYLCRSTSSRIMSPILNVGRRQPAYCTSLGNILLSLLPQQELDAYLSRVHILPFTPYAIDSVAKLRVLLDKVREVGYSFMSQQTVLLLCSLAVPVSDTSGRHVAAINVIRQGQLLEVDEMTARFLVPLQNAARELGALLTP